MEVLFRDGTVNHNCFTCSVGIGAADPCWAAQVHNFVRFSHVISIVTPLALSGGRLRFSLLDLLVERRRKRRGVRPSQTAGQTAIECLAARPAYFHLRTPIQGATK